MPDSSDRLYLDHNATTFQSREVTAAVLDTVDHVWGNPSSIHVSGQRARRALEHAREQVAELLGANADEIVFTSGGSESVNAAICSAVHSAPERRVVVTSEVEHAAVREMLERLSEEGVETIHLPSSDAGCVDPATLREVLESHEDSVALVSVMWANNETGVIEPIEELCRVCEAFGVPFHTDATQWVGKMPTDVSSLPLTMLSCAGHKFHGPKGTGVLWIKRGVAVRPLVIGGGQEQGRRGGTENVPGFVGLGTAASQAQEWLAGGGHEQMTLLRDRFETLLVDTVPGACINGATATRMWSTSSVGFPSIEAELLLLVLSERGLDASAGSACSSGAIKESAVLQAMGHQPCQIPEAPYGSVRFSWCRETKWTDLERAIQIIAESVAAIQRLRPPTDAIPAPETLARLDSQH
ncbi:MAG: aminotransferase class V-fold PLP-dependent enzyme [Phycisphaerales bacterium]|nr:aminotransferase class V-fold PLP-dependent enzyme [Phycisphaerales bacterium]